MNTYYAECDFNISAMGTAYIHGKTGIDKDINFISRKILYNAAMVDILVLLYENSIISSAGSTIVPSINMNRMSLDAATFNIYLNSPFPINDGNILSTNKLFNGLTLPVSASDLTNGVERTLRKNEDYTLKIVNNTTAATTLTFNWLWREE
jgi:hypothetical protein